jgi:hypothetical protein
MAEPGPCTESGPGAMIVRRRIANNALSVCDVNCDLLKGVPAALRRLSRRLQPCNVPRHRGRSPQQSGWAGLSRPFAAVARASAVAGAPRASGHRMPARLRRAHGRECRARGATASTPRTSTPLPQSISQGRAPPCDATARTQHPWGVVTWNAFWVMAISQDANAGPLTESEQTALETVEKKYRPSDDYVIATRISRTHWQSIQSVVIQNRTTGAARTYSRGFDAAHPCYWITRFSEALDAREF